LVPPPRGAEGERARGERKREKEEEVTRERWKRR
jgi:hypothetical protein